jgi:hypothetical protein
MLAEISKNDIFFVAADGLVFAWGKGDKGTVYMQLQCLKHYDS